MPKQERQSSLHVVLATFVRLACYFNNTTKFSPISGSVMQSTTDRVDTSCLVDPDPNRAIISLQMCGNGIVEKGEDCDPGGASSSCCDATTCKFKSGALCDPASSPCCQASCTFAPATQVCRASKDASCDQAEMCTGNSSSCPPDAFSPNGRLKLSLSSRFHIANV